MDTAASLTTPPGAAALDLVCRAEAGWREASPDQLTAWRDNLVAGIVNLRAAYARTEAAVAAGALASSDPAVLDAYRRIAPAVVARLETLLANIATRLDAPASA